MFKDLSSLESQLILKVQQHKDQFSLDCELPAEFKRNTRKIDGNTITYTKYGFKATSVLDIYFPNQLWYLAAICVPLYIEVRKYADEVKSLLSKDDIKNCKDNKHLAESLVPQTKYTEEDRLHLIEFLSNYDWWKGGKTIDRGDYFCSPILSVCNLVNVSQGYVADMCKYLSEHPETTALLYTKLDTLPVPDKSEKMLFECSSTTDFLAKCIKEFLDYDTNMSLVTPYLKFNSVTIGFNGFQLGKKKSAQDIVTDARRLDDCDQSIVWSAKDEEYYLWKEQTFDSLKVFADNFNAIYGSDYRIDVIDNRTYRLYKKTGNSEDSGDAGVPVNRRSLYRPYITAIKSKPFLLLAGISGTGKSRIVRELARACWDADSEEYKAQKPSNFEMVQVKPNWHDSSELIGYVSRVSGQPIYVAGDFLKFVARAWENPDTPYFLCLDEMNLAPVEQYFAEYLSVVESRKVDDEGNVVTDPILKKSKEDWYRVLTGELTSDDEIRKQFLEDGICIPQNLIVVGTVNMDETTFSFSRKVLDRAMTIEMNEVDLNGGLTHRHEHIGKLGAAELIGTAVEGVDVYSANKGVCDKVITYLQSVNDVLEGTPFKIAYRTRNEFLLYVVNNLPYNKDEDGDDLQEGYIIARALDEITSMKILSRIEGDESKVKESLLTKLSDTIRDGLKEVSESTWAAVATDDDFESVSMAKLQEMITRLDSGYTSFWS